MRWTTWRRNHAALLAANPQIDPMTVMARDV
jgi:Fe-S-cluster formation regulator IscX/YfhJ